MNMQIKPDASSTSHIIRLTSIGGFAGPAAPQLRQYDLAQMPPLQAQQIQALLAAVDFSQLPPRLLKPLPRASDFLHEISIDDGRQRHSVQFHHDAAGAALQALLAALQALPSD